jgi:hypothetical protein
MLHRINLSHLSGPSVLHISTSTCGSKVKARIIKSQSAPRVLDDLKIIQLVTLHKRAVSYDLIFFDVKISS